MPSGFDVHAERTRRQEGRALPLTRHDWHGDWNYTLRPEAYDQAAGAPDPSGRPGPGLAWLAHPALTGLPAHEWDALIAALMSLYDQQRETSLDKRRGHRPRLAAPGAADRLDGEGSGVMVGADGHPAGVRGQVIDAVRHRTDLDAIE